jgi:hypothetical protein
MRDLGLDHIQALHGIQTAIAHELSQWPHICDAELLNKLKHFRVGIDSAKAEQAGLAGLLIAKGIFTLEEYTEHMRLALNEELARYEEHLKTTYGFEVSCR